MTPAIAIRPVQVVPVSTPPASMSEPVPAIEAFMASYLGSLGLPSNLEAAARYALFGPGKRARPALVVHACRAVGGTLESALPAAAGVEMIHAFSLVHDDMPALDNDDLRRGRPTTHRAHGEAMALLVGDLLNTLGLQVILEKTPDPALAGALTRELAQGTTAMIAGQVYDSLGGFAQGLSDAVKLELVHRNKTGALLRACCRMGAMVGTGKAASKQLDALTVYGEAIGLMFQIVDDLLDVEQSAEHTGKATGKDAALGKLTYPGVMGAEASRREIQRLRTLALENVSTFGPAGLPLVELCEYLAVRTR